MATPLSTRVPLDDPTQDASSTAVLSAELPGRTTPVPFARVTRPEPYENQVPLTLAIPDDEATPQTATPELKKGKRIWFEGPIIPLPDSQQAEDYPADMLGSVSVDPKAALGTRRGRIRPSRGLPPWPPRNAGPRSSARRPRR